MKKFIIPAVVALGMFTFSATAQETETEPATEEVVQAPKEYKEIDKSQLPQAIKDAVINDLNGMTVSEAYMAEDGTYKLNVATPDTEETNVVYADAEGNWLKPEEAPE